MYLFLLSTLMLALFDAYTPARHLFRRNLLNAKAVIILTAIVAYPFPQQFLSPIK